MPQAVAVKGERIVACGSKSEVLALVGDQTKLVDLNGKTMLPGFIDGHGHFPWAGNDALYGVSLFSPPIGRIRNHQEGIKGSIEAGKLADLIVLEDNPLEIDPLKIRETLRYFRRLWEGRRFSKHDIHASVLQHFFGNFLNAGASRRAFGSAEATRTFRSGVRARSNTV